MMCFMPMEQREMSVPDPSEDLEGKVDYKTFVSTINYCQTIDATHLTIFDAWDKLCKTGEFNIGGTYSDTEPELWFYFTATYCHGNNFLLNLFLCQRKPGSISIQISDSNELIKKRLPFEEVASLMFPRIFTEMYTFKSAKPEQHHFIKTYCLAANIVKYNSVSTLFIPLKINVSPGFLLNENIVKSIKLQHDLSGLLAKQEKTDIDLESVTHKKFPAHKILLAAHSPVLRDMLKSAKLTSLYIDISDNDMELLLEFIYTGAIRNVMKQNCSQLFEIADKFQLKALFLLTQHVVKDQINVNNAVEMAVVAKKYNLEQLQEKVCDFILNHPEVMKTEAWLNLKDVELTKFLFKYMHSMKD